MTQSLIDTANRHLVDVWVVFVDRGMWDERTWLCRWLRPGFKHTECWRYVPPGAWLRFSTNIEALQPEVYADPPWVILADISPTVIRVQRSVPRGFFRQPWFIGPLTCVQMVAAFAGVRLPFWCRTPFQLYRLLIEEAASEKAQG